ncbi:MAG: hypothetical protein MO852_04275 [Candidatus Devosia euplotis]|nr:hypothetical protein [Candidatus Devosia euplotis]
MTNIRLLPVVVLAISALLVLKTLGLITNGGYVLTGLNIVQAAEGAAAAAEPGQPASQDHTMENTSSTLADPAPTMKPQSEAATKDAAAAGHSVSPAGAGPAADAGAAAAEPGATDHAGTADAGSETAATSGEAPAQPRSGYPMPAFAASMSDCLQSGDAVPLMINGKGAVPLLSTGAASDTEQLLLQLLAARRDETKTYEDDLTLRASIVDAAESALRSVRRP